MSTKKNKFSKKDIQYMNLALKMARARHGLTGKNPSVGCVIVKKNKIISIGQTGYNGRPHAEYNSIKNSCENLKDSKMYITLEPCNHYGKTPPCTNMIIKNNINEVIYSIDDIDKKVRGKSSKILRSKNISVKKGLLKNQLIDFYKPYFFNRKNKIPYVTGKIAISKNKLIYSKEKKKITNIHSNKFTHLLRYKNDSLMISSKTLNKDNSKLNCRLSRFDKFSPKRIILDKNLIIKTSSYIFKTANRLNTIIFYSKVNQKKISLLKKKGIKLVKINAIKNEGFVIKKILKKLYTLGCRNLLVEGGDELTKYMLKNNLFNQFYLFKSSLKLPKLTEYKAFSCLKSLDYNFKIKNKIITNLGKDSIILYRK
jgi:diaminohydroxyphosphoribosylaminopyrimidine deaminase / 5-amino-6-(5-phosphoribosylamino)uracil reductase